MVTKLVDLENKGIKGVQVYVQEGDFPPKYYKYLENTKLEDYTKIYRENLKGINIKSKIKETHFNIDSSFKTGQSDITINDFMGISTTQFKNQRKELLKPIVKDELLLNILTTDENFKKLVDRIEYQVEIMGDNGNKLAMFSVFSMEPNNFESNMRKIVSPGDYITKDYTGGFYETVKFYFNIEPLIQEEGTVKSAKVTMRFRKG